MRSIDLLGHRFKRLLVIGKENSVRTTGGNSKTMWSCICDCGKTITVSTNSLRKGDAGSCGCLQRDLAIKANTKHGKCGDITYQTWKSMIDRCSNDQLPNYKYYGGRGITVCKRWADSFENFVSDMGERPDGMSIDRIDNNGNYDIDNCRWATTEIQSRNKRNNKILTLNGKSQCVADWSKEIGLNRETIRCRLKRNWPIELALKAHSQKEINMTKQELIAAIAEHSGETKAATERFFDAFAYQLKDAAARGETVEIRGLFSVSVQAKPERTGRNPKTGQPAVIAARNAVKFKSYKDLNDAANGK